MELESRLSGIQQVRPLEAVRLMDDNTLVLDVREAQEYGSGHIKQSMHIPMSKLKTRIDELDKYKNRKILAYCRSGSRSNYACKLLKKSGFDQVYNLSGGIMGWSSANLPLTRK
jgi:rhodanese-related sulfurtransferase